VSRVPCALLLFPTSEFPLPNSKHLLSSLFRFPFQGRQAAPQTKCSSSAALLKRSAPPATTVPIRQKIDAHVRLMPGSHAKITGLQGHLATAVLV
jgi:hypothetical protein